MSNYLTQGEMTRVLVVMEALDSVEKACNDNGVEAATVTFDVTVGDVNGEPLGTIEFDSSVSGHVFKPF